MVDSIEKKIYFYKVLFKNNDQFVDPQTIFSYINSLPFDESGRYLKLNGGNIRSMFIDSTTMPLKIRIGTIRKTGLPHLETRGQTSPLKIPDDSGLYEPMHFMIFPNNIVGFESNFYGPRPASLKAYVPKKANNMVDKIELLPLMRQDITELLSRIGEIRMLRLKVNKDMGKYLKDLDDNLPDAFSALMQTTDAENIEIVLRSKSYSKTGIFVTFVERLPKWISKSEVREGVDKLIIRGRDEISGKIDEFDLLQQYLFSKKQVIKQDEIHKSIKMNAMYNAINDAYNESRPEINQIINDGK